MQRLPRTRDPITRVQDITRYAPRPTAARSNSHIATLSKLKAVQTVKSAPPSVTTRMPSFDIRAAQAAVERVQEDRDAFELIYTTDPSWPLSSSSTLAAPAPRSSAADEAPKVNIAVLDSSFNPPHLAHLAIAASSLPPSLSPINAVTEDGVAPYSARLLVFSVRNIEKTPKKGDATILQRLEMTVLLADTLAQVESKDVEVDGGAGAHVPGNGESWEEGRKDTGRRRIPVAVGILNEPTFVGKSRIIHRFLSTRTSSPSAELQEPGPSIGQPSSAAETSSKFNGRAFHGRPTLSFLIGTDTLTRFFDPKFYPAGIDCALHSFFAPPTPVTPKPQSGSDEGDGSVLVSACRGTTPSDRAIEQGVLSQELAKQWADAGRVRLLGDGSEGWEEISSTRVRKAVESENWEEVKRLVPGSVAEYIERSRLFRV